MGEVVDLDFELPLGPVSVRAVVRERNAFCYGFQFVQPNAAHQFIADACGSLPPCEYDCNLLSETLQPPQAFSHLEPLRQQDLGAVKFQGEK
jgi:hypothetical protein